MAIESLIDLKTMTIEELTGRFSACEDHYDLDDATQHTGRLRLTEEEWTARQQQRTGGSSSSGGSTKGKPYGKPETLGGDRPPPGNGGAGASGLVQLGPFCLER